MRSLGISVISVALTTMVIANAYYQKKQFYPSVVYITKSNPSMAVIYIQAFICVLLAGKLMRKIFFGELRTSEFEHLMERSWYAITETCLAFTVFRDDFNPKFVALFTLLLFLKSFHWLAEDRVDFMERSPIISYLFHIRVLALLVSLAAFDVHFVEHAYQSTLVKGASVQLVFGFEYAILITMVINVAIKYSLYAVDMNSDTPWDNKAVFLLYTELVMGLIKVILYVAFVVIMVKIYTLPLFALRPMYYTIRNFKKAFNDVILSRRAIHNMNTLYPDATLEELQAGDNVCIICREEMTTASKKLPCNHIFHASCLRSWFQRQQTCPTCRLNILRTPTPTNERQEPRHRHAPVPNVQLANQFNFNMPNPFVLLNANIRNVQQQRAAAHAAQPINPFAMPAAGAAAPGTADANIPPQTIPNLPQYYPFSPMAMPFMTPPPMPPPNLASMTTEQLRRLEGNERENIEARIQWLRNIQLMLDAGVLMFQQYNTAAALTMAMPTVPVAPQNNAPETASADTTTLLTEPSVPGTSASTSDAPPPATETAEASSTATPSTSSKSDNVNGIASPNTSSTSDSDTNENNPEAEVRRRRLQKFLQGEQQQ